MDMLCDGLGEWIGVLLVIWLDLGAMKLLGKFGGFRILVLGMCIFLGFFWIVIYGLKLGRDVIGVVLFYVVYVWGTRLIRILLV